MPCGRSNVSANRVRRLCLLVEVHRGCRQSRPQAVRGVRGGRALRGLARHLVAWAGAHVQRPPASCEPQALKDVLTREACEGARGACGRARPGGGAARLSERRAVADAPRSAPVGLYSVRLFCLCLALAVVAILGSARTGKTEACNANEVASQGAGLLRAKRCPAHVRLRNLGESGQVVRSYAMQVAACRILFFVWFVGGGVGGGGGATVE